MKINGKYVSISSEKKISLLEFLKEMNLNPQAVAVELNGEILDKSNWSHTFLSDSDRLEIIKFVGGG